MKNHSFFRSGSYSLIANGAQQVFALLQFMLVARLLTPSLLGEWAMFLTLVSLVEMARLGLVQNALVHFLNHQPEQKEQWATNTLLLNIGVLVLGTLLLTLLSPFLSQLWHMTHLFNLFLIYLCLAPILGFLRTLEGLGMANSDFRPMLISSIVFGLFYWILLKFAPIIIKLFNFEPFIHSTFGFDPNGILHPPILVFLQFIPTISAIICVCFMTNNRLKLGKIDFFLLKKMFNFGRYGMATNLCSILFQRADLFILGAFATPSSIASYNIATRLISYIDFPLNALGLAIMPKLAQIHQNSNTASVARFYEKSVGFLLALILPIVIMSFLGASYIINLFAGASFVGATPLFQILLLATIVKPFGRIFGVTLDAIGKPIWNFRMLLMSMFITLVINFVFINIWGTVGAAIASTLSIVITISIGQLLLIQWLPVRFIFICKSIPENYLLSFKLLKNFNVNFLMKQNFKNI